MFFSYPRESNLTSDLDQYTDRDFRCRVLMAEDQRDGKDTLSYKAFDALLVLVHMLTAVLSTTYFQIIFLARQ